MKICLSIILLIVAASAYGQKSDDVLATAKGHIFSAKSLSPEGQKILAGKDSAIENARTRLLAEMIAEIVLDLEAKASNTTAEKLIDAIEAKVPQPTNAQIQAVYEANRAALGSKTLDQVRQQIVDFLQSEPRQKAVDAYIQVLRAKHKVVLGKSINAPDLKSLESVVTIGTKSISVQEFESENRLALHDIAAHHFEDVKSDLEAAVLSALVAEEAKARSTDASGIIAAEITNKLRDYSDEERADLESALQKRLFAKYEVKLLIKEPPPVVQNISTDDDPVLGKTTAPVTVVMFSDFQCSACARTHPVLTRVMAEFGDKVRFVVRDFPLENIHENAFRAAVAANAANAQGKFFEFIDVLYRNQDALDNASLRKYAAELGLNAKQFEIDLGSEKAAAEIRKDKADGTTYGVSGTPTIFINGIKLHRLSADSFRDAIENALVQKSAR